MTITVKDRQIIVDDEDAHLLTDYHWSVVTSRGRSYAIRGGAVAGSRYTIYLHHAVAGQHLTLHTDHVNGNSLDNRRSNLRFATRQQNLQNRRKLTKNTSSRFKGVHWCPIKRRWKSRFLVAGKIHWVGSFKDEVQAAKAYNVKVLEVCGEFACLNNVFDL